MKYFLLIISFAIPGFLFSCKKKEDSNADDTEPNDTAKAYWIPNWATDTLVGVGINPENPSDTLDVIFSFKRDDTTLINYDGADYYIWLSRPNGGSGLWFENNSNEYDNVIISTTAFDITTSVLSGTACSITPSQYTNAGGGVTTQYQTIKLVPPHLPFATWVTDGFYSTQNKSMLP